MPSYLLAYADIFKFVRLLTGQLSEETHAPQSLKPYNPRYNRLPANDLQAHRTLAGKVGFEPTTHWLTASRSTR